MPSSDPKPIQLSRTATENYPEIPVSEKQLSNHSRDYMVSGRNRPLQGTLNAGGGTSSSGRSECPFVQVRDRSDRSLKVVI